MLNVDLKKKDHYEPKYYQHVNDLIVLIAKNKENETLFNVINIDGETPKNFSANWRSPHHVVQELKKYLN